MGRRKLYPDQSLVGFNVKMSERDLNRIRLLAKEQGKPCSTLVREFISKQLNAA